MGINDSLQEAYADDGLSERSFKSAHSTLNDLDTGNTLPPLLRLPSEVLYHVLTFLECQHLVSLIRTCRRLRELAETDLLWSSLLRQHIPPLDFPDDSPFPASTYRHLYQSHHPYWFLPRYKIWFSDEDHVGKLILCKFDPRRGCIEGYRLLATGGRGIPTHWSYKPSVFIHSFSPKVRLWLDDPVLSLPHDVSPLASSRQGWWEGEIRMTVGRSNHNTAASFFLALDIPQHLQSPSTALWPPKSIPNMPRTRCSSGNGFTSKGHKPQSYDQISQTAFRTRQWSQFFSGPQRYGIRLGEEVNTWSTLDPSLYTPTKEKPYQGIFVGDYAGHGCEFLLVIQTARAPAPAPRTEPSDQLQRILRAMQLQLASATGQLDALAQAQVESMDPVPPNLDDPIAHSGALEAIKLTGDINVPRGEHTFIADDLGPGGFIRIASEQPFTGARVVRSRGHVASDGFQDDDFVPSQLILTNPNRMAQFWVPLGHISYYERVDIDALLANTSYPRRASQ